MPSVQWNERLFLFQNKDRTKALKVSLMQLEICYHLKISPMTDVSNDHEDIFNYFLE